MMICMRTTLDLDDDLVRKAKRRAAESGTTLTAVIEDALRVRLARASTRPKKAVKLPTYGKGGVFPGVDLSNNASLEDIMDGVDDPHGR